MVCKDFILHPLNTCANAWVLTFWQIIKAARLLTNRLGIKRIKIAYFLAITVTKVMSDIAVPSMPTAVE